MGFIEEVKQFSVEAGKRKNKCATEQATKMALIVPFLKILGYDVHNPEEVIPEYSAAVPGVKKDEKVDYAIIIDEQPLILIEAKRYGENLENHSSQLFKYFNATAAKFGILTDGVIYRFYTDLDKDNIMDQTPFLEFDLLNLRESTVGEVKKFHKDTFDVGDVTGIAGELKYTNAIKNFFAAQLEQPTDDFTRYILSEVYSGKKMQSIVETFIPIVKKSLNDLIDEMMTDKISAALRKDVVQNPPNMGTVEDIGDDDDEPSEVDELIPTEEELQCYYIVKAVLGKILPLNRITHKKTERYFNVKIDGKVTKWICRIHIKERVRFLQIPDGDKQAISYYFEDASELYALDSKIIERAKTLVNK